MNWHLFALLGSGLLFTAGLSWFFAEAWSFAVRTHTAWLVVLLAITSTIAVSAQTYLCAVILSIYPANAKPEGVTPVNRQAFASFPFDSAACLVRQKGTTDRPAVGWEVVPSLAHRALSIDPAETPKPTPLLDTPAPAPFDSHGGTLDKGNVEGTLQEGDEVISRVPSGAYGGKGYGASRSSSSSPPTKASVETRENVGVDTPPGTNQSGRDTDEDAVTEAMERGIAARFDLASSPAAHGSPREEKTESDAAEFAGADSPRPGEGQKRYTYCWGSPGVLPMRQIVLDVGEVHDCEEGGRSKYWGTHGRDQSHDASIDHLEAVAGFRAGLDVSREAAALRDGSVAEGERRSGIGDRSSVLRVSELSDVCAICLGKYSAGERVHVLPCLHIFHEQCLDVWIASHPSCPYCKGDLNIFPPEYEATARRDSARRFAICMLSILECPVDWLRARQPLWRRDQGGGVVGEAPAAVNSNTVHHA